MKIVKCKYPRKFKKFLKKTGRWNYIKKIEKDIINICINNESKVEQIDLVMKYLKEKSIPIDYSKICEV